MYEKLSVIKLDFSLYVYDNSLYCFFIKTIFRNYIRLLMYLFKNLTSVIYYLFQTVSISMLLRYAHHQIFVFIGKSIRTNIRHNFVIICSNENILLF